MSKLERMKDVFKELEKALDMNEGAEVLKKAAIGFMALSAGLYAGSEVCKWTEGVFLDRAAEIVDEIKEDEENKEED